MTDKDTTRRNMIYSVISGKGGVGKTAIACNLAASLALLGRRVLLVDGDVGLKNVDIFLGIEEFVIADLCDLISEKCRPEQAMIVHPKIENLFVLPAALSREKEILDPDQFQQVIRTLARDFDYTFIDAPHGIGDSFRMTLLPAHRVIVVTSPERSSIIKSDKVVGMAEEAGIDPRHIKLIINRVEEDLRREKVQQNCEEILEHLKLDLLGELPFDLDLYEACETGRLLTLNQEGDTTGAFLTMAKIIDGESAEPPRVKSRSLFGRLLRG